MRRRSLIALLVTVGVLVAACGGPAPSPSASPSDIAVASPSPSPSASPSPSPTPAASPSPSPSASVVYGDLDGLPADPAVAHRLPLAVPIDDNRVARPQSGFNGASIVYQAPADGGETRYLFVYQSGDSRDIGPVRSARLYFVRWAAEYRAAFAHYGGDVQTMTWIRNDSDGLITNVDALFGSAAAFHRISSRKAPHNAYTSTADLRAMASRRGGSAELDPAIHRRAFVDESPVAERGVGQTIRVPYNTGVVTYEYDRAANVYRRSLDGRAQVDPADGKRVTTRNVVVLFQKFRIDTKIEPGHSRPVIESIGQGTAWIFREGMLTKGQWSKADEGATTLLLDASGKEIPLVRGNSFFQVVPLTTKVTVGD